MKTTVFSGSAVAIVTPMNTTDSAINYDLLARMIDWQISEGTDAIVICGTTGEISTLTGREYTDVVSFTVAHTAGRVPVIAGAGSNDTAHAIWLSKKAEAAGADALLLVTPYYNKTTQEGLICHFCAIADSTLLPIILYNVPARTGVNIAPVTYARLAEHPRIVAVKEANGDIASVAHSMALCRDSLAFYSGNDDQIVSMMALGALGVISVLANVAPAMTHRIAKLCLAGDFAAAAQLQIDAMGLIASLFCEVNPIPVKEAMKLIGFDCGECRLPLPTITPENRDRLRRELEKRNIMEIHKQGS